MHIAIYITIFIILIISNNTQAVLKFLQPANSYYFLAGIPYTNVSHISVMSSSHQQVSNNKKEYIIYLADCLKTNILKQSGSHCGASTAVICMQSSFVDCYLNLGCEDSF